jgi:hypothetical protein
MAYTVQSIYNRMPSIFSGRNVLNTDSYEATRKAVLELSENYKFQGLENTGPTVPLTVNLAGPYAYNTFLQVGDAGLTVNMFDSFFIYYSGVAPVINQANPGFPLKYKSIDTLEILMNLNSGVTTNWTRFNDQIYFAMAPNLPYYVYLRYQKQHPFPNAGTGAAGTDPILLPDSWQDIVEYATAERLASDYNLDARMTKFHNIIYGDPKFQATGGTEGSPGLIFSRTQQYQRDQQTTQRSLRLMMRPYMR